MLKIDYFLTSYNTIGLSDNLGMQNYPFDHKGIHKMTINNLITSIPKIPRFDSLFILNSRREVIPEPDVIKWGKWMETANTHLLRVVGKDQIGPFLVSTIFLGINHSINPARPLCFESMVFDSAGNYLRPERYYTWAEAKKGHENLCDDCRQRAADQEAGLEIFKQITASDLSGQ